MNIIEAIVTAKKRGVNVVNTASFSYRYGLVPEHDQTNVAPGKIDPNYLFSILGQIYEHDVLADIWEVEDEVITITYKQYTEAFEKYLREYPFTTTAYQDSQVYQKMAENLGFSNLPWKS